MTTFPTAALVAEVEATIALINSTIYQNNSRAVTGDAVKTALDDLSSNLIDTINAAGSAFNSIPPPALTSLTDVQITEGSAINGDLISWNNSIGKWVAVAPSAGLPWVTLEQYDTSGGTNYWAALVAANAALAATGGVIMLGAKTYPMVATASLTNSANLTIAGQGKGASVLAISHTTGLIVFNHGNPFFTVQDLTIRHTPANGITGQLFSWNSNYFAARRCEFDGTCTGNSPAYTTLCFNFSTGGTQTGIEVDRCLIHGWIYPFLKANTWAGNTTNVKVTFNTFYANYADDIAFNTPLGSIDDVVCEGNTCMLPAGASPQTGKLGISWAGATRVRCVNNYILGDYQNPIHCEQQALDCIITGNYCEGWLYGIFILQNNVGGTQATPTRMVVADNTVVYRGSNAGGLGLYVVFNSVSFASAIDSIIKDNIFNGWPIGLQSGAFVASAVSIEDNQAYNCGTGFIFFSPSHWCQRNKSVNCTIGVEGAGGVIGSHFFQNCATPLQATGPNNYVCIEEMTFVIPPQSFVGGSVYTYVPLFALGAFDMFSMTGRTSLDVAATGFFGGQHTLSYGGASSVGPAAFTTATTYSLQTPGAWSLGFASNSGNCALAVFNAGGNITCAAEVKLSGQYLRKG